MGRYVLKDGEPVVCPDLMEWAHWIEHHKFDCRLRHKVKDNFISTVFLGLDHCYSSDKEAPPILWETMVFWTKQTQRRFGKELTWDDQWRFSTMEDAHAFHRQKVEEVRALCRRKKREMTILRIA